MRTEEYKRGYKDAVRAMITKMNYEFKYAGEWRQLVGIVEDYGLRLIEEIKKEQ